ncbi:MAG: nicotinic acid mononucleotide adenylyltransferase [Rhizobiales bacterium 17-65-6]|nr:MAG: nicotinic acid mononucleotide adenylyltransferase [Rhizobiales bacterium 12-68-15]OYX87535.1 MAG: nicotinic acid mononucleotide adenylyltransferase [Azorhizobium sp. 35-67-5]OYX88374.1 MAG: nicotinic acid mononucleotide adenylyltransferase [Azorhizobium sp. 32-67-21]OZA01159.1 MAG: nicotinic acid mononucleotide adenylyltransferase [Rhizobiales bacterium 17-65-6]
MTRGGEGRDPLRLPLVTPGLKVGLFGGSFNPAHAAHRDVSLLALKRLRLDRVWWLVSPGNPLKDNSRLPTLAERVAYARRVAAHPRIDVTGIEASLGTRYTFETVAALRARAPQVRFVWIMGADNLTGFHRWQNWRDLAGLLPVAVVDRMGDSLSATASRAARALARYRVEESDAALLPTLPPPAWVFLHGMKSPLSSTRIRARAAGDSGGGVTASG